jgi:hypothetical protein
MGGKPGSRKLCEVGVMTGAWGWVEAASLLLERDEREAVLGDLAEAEVSAVSSLLAVLNLALRREFELWTSWRPWAASLGLALPVSLFLMGFSLAVSSGFARLMYVPIAGPFAFSLLAIPLARIVLLICWGWMAGFAVGVISRRTLWASALACCAPCVLCLSEWPGSWVSGMQLLLFLAPALWGVRSGLRKIRLGAGWAVFFATTAMFVPLMWNIGGRYGLGLLWPGWFLVLEARRRPEIA